MGQCIHCKEYFEESEIVLHVLCCHKNPNYKLNQYFKDKKQDFFEKEIEKMPEDELELAVNRITKTAKRENDEAYKQQIRTLLINMVNNMKGENEIDVEIDGF